MKKNLIAMTAAVALAASMGTAALAANDDVTVIVNGETIDFTGDQAPVVVNERTLVPFRAVFEKLGAEVNWYDDSKVCEATYGSITVSLTIGDNVMYIGDGTTVEVDSPAQIINDRTMVPVRVISESIGALVGWDEDTRTVTVDLQEATDETPTSVEMITSTKGTVNETTGVTVTFDFPVVTDEFTASGKMNDAILGDIIELAQKTADSYTGDEKEIHIAYSVNKNEDGLLELLYTIDDELVYQATYSTATGAKIDDDFYSELYGDGSLYSIDVYTNDNDATESYITASAEYPQFKDTALASLNTQLENSAKKAVDSFIASYSDEAAANKTNYSFTEKCTVEIDENNIATITTTFTEVTSETREGTDVITVDLTTGEATNAADAATETTTETTETTTAVG